MEQLWVDSLLFAKKRDHFLMNSDFVLLSVQLVNMNVVLMRQCRRWKMLHMFVQASLIIIRFGPLFHQDKAHHVKPTCVWQVWRPKVNLELTEFIIPFLQQLV